MEAPVGDNTEPVYQYYGDSRSVGTWGAPGFRTNTFKGSQTSLGHIYETPDFIDLIARDMY